MSELRILSVVGARPQFIKASVVSEELDRHHDEVLVHTGQHYDKELSDVFFDELGLPEPDYNLGVGSGSHGEQTAEMIVRLEELVKSVDPDVLLCYGDTNSTLAAGVVGSKTDACLAHVEAGLRSHERSMPEEVNRVLTDHAADVLLVPSRRAARNLERENLSNRTYVVGDVMYESLLRARDRAATASDTLSRFGVDSGEFVLATVHRPRNTEDPARLRQIIDALDGCDRSVIFPAHPRTVDALKRHDLLDRAEATLTVTEPLGYVDFVRLMDTANRVATDSGGVQKECFFLDTPCLTLREETEWTETVDAGWNVLVGADRDAIETALSRPFELDGEKPSPYGDATATRQIRERLEAWIADTRDP